MALIDLESEEETKEDDDTDDYSLLSPPVLTERGLKKALICRKYYI